MSLGIYFDVLSIAVCWGFALSSVVALLGIIISVFIGFIRKF